MHPLDAYDNEEPYKKFRFRLGDILAVTDEVREDIGVSNRLRSLPPTLQVFVAPRLFCYWLISDRMRRSFSNFTITANGW